MAETGRRRLGRSAAQSRGDAPRPPGRASALDRSASREGGKASPQTLGSLVGSRRLLRYALQGATLATLTAGIIVLTTSEPSTWERLHAFPWWGFPCLFLVVAMSWVANAARLRLIAQGMGYALRFRNALTIVLSADFGIAATPGGVGGAAIRIGLLRQFGFAIPIGCSMLAVDMMVDWLLFGVLLLFAIADAWDSTRWRSLVFALWQALPKPILWGITAATVLLLVWRYLPRRHHGCPAGLGRLPGRWVGLQRRLRADGRELRSNLRLGRSAISLLFSNHRGLVGWVVLMSMVQMGCRYGVLPLTIAFFTAGEDPFALMAFQGFAFGLSMLLVFPGGGGGVELLTLYVLSNLIPKPSVGVVLFLWRLYTYHLYLAAGGLVFFRTLSRLDGVSPQVDANRRADRGINGVGRPGPADG